jgi:hypothetical protein
VCNPLQTHWHTLGNVWLARQCVAHGCRTCALVGFIVALREPSAHIFRVWHLPASASFTVLAFLPHRLCAPRLCGLFCVRGAVALLLRVGVECCGLSCVRECCLRAPAASGL